MDNRFYKYHVGSGIALIFLMLVVVFLSSCKKEVSPEKSDSDLRYEPFGPNRYMRLLFPGDRDHTLGVYDNGEIVKLDGATSKVVWSSLEFDNLKAITDLTNSDYLILQGANNGITGGLKIGRLNDNGKAIFKQDGYAKLFPEYPDWGEQTLALVPADDAGAWALIVLENQNGAFRRFLIHIDRNNAVDHKIRLYERYTYLAADGNQVYLTKRISPEGSQMTLQTVKPNMDVLFNSGLVQSQWNYFFDSNEADWHWEYYLPFFTEYHDGGLFIIKQHNTGVNDQATGLDIIEVNSTDGSEASNFVVEFDFSVNSYLDKPTFHPLFDKDRIYLAYNYGSKSKLALLERSGQIIRQISLAAVSGKSHATGIGFSGDRIVVHGLSTLNKSPDYIPFLYLTDK